MITLHHLNDSRSQRILWLLEEMSLDYEIKKYERDAKTNLAPQSLKDIHPLGKSPVISDSGGDGSQDEIIVAETGAIIEYLVDTYRSEFRPEKGTQSYRDYLYWLHFGEGSMMPQLLLKLIFDRIKTAKMPFFAKPIARKIADNVLDNFCLPNLKNDLVFIEKQLTDKTWFCGDELTGADIMMSFPLEAAMSRAGGNQYPHIKKYVTQLQARDAYKKALSVGGEYRFNQSSD